MAASRTSRLVVISGCSGGGKSSLLAELRARGFATVEEPGRRIVIEVQARGGAALPWVDMEAFCRRALELAIQDYDAAETQGGWVFLDRSVIDAASALQHLTGATLDRAAMYHYHERVFFTPPWPAIYVQDTARRHDLSAAVEEYDRLVRDYRALGYEVARLPLIDVASRADFVLAALPPQRQSDIAHGRLSPG